MSGERAVTGHGAGERAMRVPDPVRWRADRVSQDRVADYQPFGMVDGPGVRCSLYVSGCLFDCPGCYNTAARSFRYGQVYDETLEARILSDLGHEAVQGLSLLGGEPFLNTRVCLRIARAVRDRFGSAKDIWVWTGYTIEELLGEIRNGRAGDKEELLELADVLVDGPYLREQHRRELAFRGSANQRILDVRASLAGGGAVPWAATRHAATASVGG